MTFVYCFAMLAQIVGRSDEGRLYYVGLLFMLYAMSLGAPSHCGAPNLCSIQRKLSFGSDRWFGVHGTTDRSSDTMAG